MEQAMSDRRDAYDRAVEELRSARAALLPYAEQLEKVGAYFSEWKAASAKGGELPGKLAVNVLSGMLQPWPTQDQLWKAFTAWEAALDKAHRAYHRLAGGEREKTRPPDELSI
jgi:hypothetical protein